LDFKVQISTPGLYRLWVRWGGYDGSSDSLYGQIVELMTPGPGPDWYRFAQTTLVGGVPDFNIAWAGSGAPSTDPANNVSAGGGEVPATWQLDAGTYTVRFCMREDGSAIDAFILQLNSLAAPASPGPAESTTTTTFITVTQQPQDVSVAPGQNATFTVAATGSATPTYQWQKAAPGSTNFANITGATGTSYTANSVAITDDGSRYRVVISVPGTTINSRTAALAVDITPPIAYRAEGSPKFDRVTIVFSEAVSAATGTNLANYSIAGLTISNAVLAAGNTNVTLFTSKQTTGTVYTVTVKDIQDRVTPPNTLSPNPTTVKFTAFVLRRGGALQEYWQNITVNTIATLTNDARFPDNPSFFTVEPAFEYPPNGANEAGSNYGNKLSGWLVPSATADYVFFVCSDDPSVLYLSHDANPANKHLIAQETVWSNARQWGAVASGGASDLTAKRSDQFSLTEWPNGNQITLTNGQMYYIEALHTEGGGGDNVGATWIVAGANDPADGSPPIQGSNLFTYMNPDATTASITITGPTNKSTFAAGANVPITVNAVDTNGPIRRVDFFANGTKVVSSTNSPFSVAWTNVATGRYTITASALDRSGFVVTAPTGVKITVGTPGPLVYFVTADPGPLTFPGDIAVQQRLLSRGFDVQLVRGSDVPNNGSTVSDGDLIIESSSLGSGTVEYADPVDPTQPAIGKFKFLAIPAIEWEGSSQDAFGFQAANGAATGATETNISIVDATSPLAAGFPVGLVTVATAVQPISYGTPTGAHIVATTAIDPSQACIYYYEKGDKGYNDFVMPARRVFYYFGDATATALTADGLKLFDAAVDWAVNVTKKPVIAALTHTGSTITFTWTGGGTLQEATDLTGSWSPVAGNPQGTYSVQTTGTRKFYRVSVP
jgi:hypothetical protein